LSADAECYGIRIVNLTVFKNYYVSDYDQRSVEIITKINIIQLYFVVVVDRWDYFPYQLPVVVETVVVAVLVT